MLNSPSRQHTTKKVNQPLEDYTLHDNHHTYCDSNMVGNWNEFEMLTKAKVKRRRPVKLVGRETRQGIRKRETHELILASARSIARREGLRAASVPRVMTGADLTVGGFYGHFPSKTAMDVEIVTSMLSVLPGRWLSGLEDLEGTEWAKAAVERYLNIAHRDNPDGCAFPAVLSEIASAPDEVRLAFAEAMELRVRAFQSQVPPVAGFTARERALAAMALTIGGLLLSRASRGNPLSEEFLAACKRWALPEMDAKPQGRPGKGSR
jgi:TetR/AcrR family transcriptional repressor of nem operon